MRATLPTLYFCSLQAASCIISGAWEETTSGISGSASKRKNGGTVGGSDFCEVIVCMLYSQPFSRAWSAMRSMRYIFRKWCTKGVIDGEVRMCACQLGILRDSFLEVEPFVSGDGLPCCVYRLTLGIDSALFLIVYVLRVIGWGKMCCCLVILLA